MMPRISFLLGILLFVGFPALGATEEALKPIPEYSMKVAYLYNFAQLTSWPDSSTADGDFNLCIYGSDDFGSALKTLSGKTINSRHVRVLHVTDTTDAQRCQLVFVADNDGARSSRLFEALRSEAILTVTDDEKTAKSGAMLMIRAEEQRLSFDVNLDAAKRAQLTFSSKLLRLAKKVTGE